MARVKEASADLIETGTEPEFITTHIARHDQLANGWARIYFAAHRSGVDRVEFSVLCAPDDLAKMASQCMDIAVQGHNVATFSKNPKAMPN